MENNQREIVQTVVNKTKKLATGEVKTYQYTIEYSRKPKAVFAAETVAAVKQQVVASVQHKRIIADHGIKSAYWLHKILAM